MTKYYLIKNDNLLGIIDTDTEHEQMDGIIQALGYTMADLWSKMV